MLVTRALLNGTAVGVTQYASLASNSSHLYFSNTTELILTAGDTLALEILVDSAGAGGTNDGGYYTFNPTLAGWASAPSSALTIARRITEAQ